MHSRPRSLYRRRLWISPVVLLFATLTFSERAPGQRTTDVQALQTQAERFREQAEAERVAAHAWAAEHGYPIRQVVNNDQVMELVGLRDGEPIYRMTLNANAADTVSTDEVRSGGSANLSLDGTGILLGIWDGGPVRTTDVEFGGTHLDGTEGRARQRDGAVFNDDIPTWWEEFRLQDHATHVSGTLIATGLDPRVRGMSSQASLDCYDWTNDLGEMAVAAANGLQVSNHSYGEPAGWVFNVLGDSKWAWYGNECISGLEDYRFGFYNDEARNVDFLAYRAPYYLPCWAAGNATGIDVHNGQDDDEVPILGHWVRSCGAIGPEFGPWVWTMNRYEKNGGSDGFDTINGKALAKNVLTVGNVQDVIGGYGFPTDVFIVSSSSRGPADDGRIKPDICANGFELLSPTAFTDTSIGPKTGTSMASPNVAGSLGLLIQHYRDTHGGQDMRAATLKGLVLHTADEVGLAPGPDYECGWGLLNTERAAARITNDVFDDDSITEITLNQGGTFFKNIAVDGGNPIRATICWTDPAGSVPPRSLDPRTRVLVNDLDLSIMNVDSGIRHRPWVLNFSVPGDPAATGINRADNVEQVFIEEPDAGQYTISISHIGTLSGGSQDVSLILSVAGDCNNNGVDDEFDVAQGGSADCNTNDVPDDCEPDGDGDGAIDECDGCPEDFAKLEPGLCGCGEPETSTDQDDDGVADCLDGCPEDPNKTEPLFCGCGLPETDTDGDLTADCADLCPDDPNKVDQELCGCGVPETDSDGDNVPDCFNLDGCPLDPRKLEPGTCGCGVADDDGDGDQAADCIDGCPSDTNKTDPGLCGCGVTELADDSDHDGTIDCFDGCRFDGDKIEPGHCGCGSPDRDIDQDGVLDCDDGCPYDGWKITPEVCGCGWPETDSDQDGLPDCHDSCPTDPDKHRPGVCGCLVSDADSDGDGVADCHDSCPQDPFKRDPQVCGCGLNDFDSDGDGTPDECTDDCPGDPFKSLPGRCGCGVSDVDGDQDGVPDCVDNCPNASNAGQADADGDGLGDICDNDSSQVSPPTTGDGGETNQDNPAQEGGNNSGIASLPGCGFGVASTSLPSLFVLLLVRLNGKRFRKSDPGSRGGRQSPFA